MRKLQIIEAIYYDPNDRDRSYDVTKELKQIVDYDNHRLFYSGEYNDIFGDPAKRVNKRLKIVLEFNYHKYTQVYKENEKIDIPSDLPREPMNSKEKSDWSKYSPSERELSVMEYLHKEYRKSGVNKGMRAIEIFQTLNIPNGQDVSTLNDSRYLKNGLDGTHETFKLSTDGIRYMDHFYGLILHKYEELAGLIRDGEMVNKDKASRARQWAKERVSNVTETYGTQSIYNETILGDKVVSSGTNSKIKTGKKSFGNKGGFTSKFFWYFIVPILVALIIYYLFGIS